MSEPTYSTAGWKSNQAFSLGFVCRPYRRVITTLVTSILVVVGTLP